MNCLYPRVAFDTGRINPDTGRRVITFEALPFPSFRRELVVPCGKCAACLRNRRHQWISRMQLELFSCDKASFITLTYNSVHCPSHLVKKDLQDFFKRLRNVSRDFDIIIPPIRYFACGEYGKKSHRPHYHAIVFGVDMLHDHAWLSYPCGFTNGRLRYSSKVLEKVWGKGFVVVGDASFQSIRYVSKYISKQYQDDSKSHDEFPPFTLKSIGLGRSLFVDVKRHGRKYDYFLLPTFFERYADGCIYLPSSSGYSSFPLPRVLDRYAERFASSLFNSVKARRREFSIHYFDDVSPSVRRDFINFQHRTELMKGELDND